MLLAESGQNFWHNTNSLLLFCFNKCIFIFVHWILLFIYLTWISLQDSIWFCVYQYFKTLNTCLQSYSPAAVFNMRFVLLLFTYGLIIILYFHARAILSCYEIIISCVYHPNNSYKKCLDLILFSKDSWYYAVILHRKHARKLSRWNLQ